VTNPDQRTPLYIHTLETLCDELVSGRAVLLDDEGNVFRLTSPETRSIFDWYRRNVNKWAKRVPKEDVEALADQLDIAPPELPVVASAEESGKQHRVHLKSMRAHRFAGIHWYGTPEQPPNDFDFEFQKPLTLIEGMNGSGKTSLLSCITWCLTGHVYRSQRPPETVDQSVLVEIVEEMEANPDDKTSYDMTAITPMPSSDVLKSLGRKPLPLDTWVELLFVDDEGKVVGTIRRSVERSPRGKIVVSEPDFSSLGLDPIAREIGTRIPGLIPYIQLGIASDLGKAVAALTGIKPLEDLVEHATRSQARLRKDLVKDREADIEKLDSDFLKAREELEDIIEEHPAIDPKTPLPAPGPNKSIEKSLADLAHYFEALEARALAESQSILGESFDYKDRTTRVDLKDNVGPAQGLLDAGNLKRLPSANRLGNLACLKDDELSEADALIQRLSTEANELSELAEQPDLAARLRLYARVAGWVKGLPKRPHDITHCPVCQSVLKGKVDDLTGTAISEHIRQYLDTEGDYLEKTIGDWEESALATLANGLPETLQSEMNRDLPESPTDLVRTALVDELFESPFVKGSLAPLRLAVETLFKAEFKGLPPFAEPPAITLPTCFAENGGRLAQAIGRVTRAVAFARWRKDNDKACKDAFAKIIGKAKPRGETAKSPDTPIESWSLSERLGALTEL